VIIEIGHFALILALILAVLQGTVPLIGAARGRDGWMQLAQKTSVPLLGLCTIAFFALMHAYALSDFSVRTVAENSHTMKPVLYKITATWANHEGSMLLWALILSYWTCRLALTTQDIPLTLRARALAVQALVCFGFFSFILFTSNPFLRLSPAPGEGLGLNPVLQDPLLAAHPPMLYMGYVGYSVVFSLAVAGLLQGRIDRDFAKIALPWARAAWIFLTAGIALGAFWAYYELGWGGFWFWDPVENAALMPWLSGTALLHTLAALERKGQFPAWTAFLAILTFSLSLLGTFLVRSGIITSVHAFAVDPARGLFILVLLSMVTGGALWLFALRAPAISESRPFAPFSREGGIFLNNLLLFAFLTAVFTGTLYPLLMTTLGAGDISVGPPYYNVVLIFFLPAIALLMAVAPMTVWGQDINKTQFGKTLGPLAAASTVGLAGFFFADWSLAAIVGFCSGALIVLGTTQHFFQRSAFMTNWSSVTAPYLGMVLSHMGLGVVIVGLTAVTTQKQEVLVWAEPGQTVKIAQYQLTYRGVIAGLGPNYNTEQATLELKNAHGAELARLAPQKNWHPVARQMTSEVDLYLTPSGGMIYAVLGDADEKSPERVTLRVYHHPLAAAVLGGAGFLVLGALLAFFQRQRRGDHA
jgi:cytochrome c-type biogenesis protein CcmF